MPETLSSNPHFMDLVGTPNVIGVSALIVAILFSFLIHWLLFKLLTQASRRQESAKWQQVLEKVRGVARVALMILAVEMTLPLTDMPEQTVAVISRLVTMMFIAICGWLAVMVVHVTSEFSMGRHRIDVEDNLEARKIRTRLRVLRQAVTVLIYFVTIAAILMTFPNARNIGVSLFASAGVAGIVVGFAARPVLSNLLAGIQIALTQPIRIDDAVVIEGEWGWIEEITWTYVVVKIWDWRRLIVPLTHVIEQPFQNWTRETASIIGNVTWHTDYTVPVDEMRAKLKEFLQASPHWDGNVQVLQVINSGTETMELRALMSAKNSPTAWDLRCEIREKMINWLQQAHPKALPRRRANLHMDEAERLMAE